MLITLSVPYRYCSSRRAWLDDSADTVVVTEMDWMRTRALNTGMGWVTSAMSMQVFTEAHAGLS